MLYLVSLPNLSSQSKFKNMIIDKFYDFRTINIIIREHYNAPITNFMTASMNLLFL